MRGRIFLLWLGIAGLIIADASSASAQVVNDFLCSTFSYKCNQQPALPPPHLAPAEVTKPATAKHAAARRHKTKATAKGDAEKQAVAPSAPAPQ